MQPKVDLFNRLGIMQGRLLPKYNNRYQAHPVGYWEEEFPIAADLGLRYIEFIFDYNNVYDNPLMSDLGLNNILTISQQYNISVKTVCADYFMEYPLHAESEIVRHESRSILLKLLKNCEKIGVTDIIVPCVDQSSLTTIDKKNTLIDELNFFSDKLEKINVNLCLETDLGPNDFIELLNRIDTSKVKVNYDIGNSASLGYNIIEEFQSYGSKITDIHIKDRVYNGTSVMLGEGDADFSSFFNEFEKIYYDGPMIFQAFRDVNGLEDFNIQFEWFRQQYLKHIKIKNSTKSE